MRDGVGVHADDPRMSTATRERVEAGGVSGSCEAARTLGTWHVKAARHAFTSPRHLRLHVTAGPSSTREITRLATPAALLPSPPLYLSLSRHTFSSLHHTFFSSAHTRADQYCLAPSFSPMRVHANETRHSLHPPHPNISGEPGHDDAFNCARQHPEEESGSRRIKLSQRSTSGCDESLRRLVDPRVSIA
jgi:hypothetical protein